MAGHTAPIPRVPEITRGAAAMVTITVVGGGLAGLVAAIEWDA